MVYSDCRRPDHMAHVHSAVLNAEVFHDFCVLEQGCVTEECERPGVSAWVIDGDLELEMRGIGAPITLDHVKLFGMRVPSPIEPTLVVESHGIYDQRVSIPPASGVPVPKRIQILRMASVHEDLPVAMYVPLE